MLKTESKNKVAQTRDMMINNQLAETKRVIPVSTSNAFQLSESACLKDLNQFASFAHRKP